MKFVMKRFFGSKPEINASTAKLDAQIYLMNYRDHYADILGKYSNPRRWAELFLFRGWTAQYGYRILSTNPEASEKLIGEVVNASKYCGLGIFRHIHGFSVGTELGSDFISLIGDRWREYDDVVVSNKSKGSLFSTVEVVAALTNRLGVSDPNVTYELSMDFHRQLDLIKRTAVEIGVLVGEMPQPFLAYLFPKLECPRPEKQEETDGFEDDPRREKFIPLLSGMLQLWKPGILDSAIRHIQNRHAQGWFRIFMMHVCLASILHRLERESEWGSRLALSFRDFAIAQWHRPPNVSLDTDQKLFAYLQDELGDKLVNPNEDRLTDIGNTLLSMALPEQQQFTSGAALDCGQAACACWQQAAKETKKVMSSSLPVAPGDKSTDAYDLNRRERVDELLCDGIVKAQEQACAADATFESVRSILISRS